MSIKTFRDHEHTLLIFLALSVLLHLGAMGLLELLPKDLLERERVLTTPIPVEIEAPPLAQEAKRAPEKAVKEPEKTRQEETKPKEFVREVPRPDETNISKEKKEAEHLSSKEQRVVRETVPLPGKTEKPGAAAEGATGSTPPQAKAALPPAGSAGKGEATQPRPLEGEGAIKTEPGAKAGKRRPSLFPSDEQLTNLAKKESPDTRAPATKSVKRKSDVTQGGPGESPAISSTYELGHSLQINTEELDLSNYASAIAHKLDLYWDYPSAAAKNGWQGTLRMLFRINKDGSITDFKVVRSTGYPALDENVITALKLGALYPPLPDKWERDFIEVFGEFHYVIVSAR